MTHSGTEHFRDASWLASRGLMFLGSLYLFAFVWTLARTDDEAISLMGWSRSVFAAIIVTIPYGVSLIVAGLGVRARKPWAKWTGIALTTIGILFSLSNAIQAIINLTYTEGILYLAMVLLFGVVLVSVVRLDF